MCQQRNRATRSLVKAGGGDDRKVVRQRVRSSSRPNDRTRSISALIASRSDDRRAMCVTPLCDRICPCASARYSRPQCGRPGRHVVLPWSHRAFSLLKRWALGTYHGLRRKHVDTYLNEFVFRYNRRFYRHVSFEALLGLATHHEPTGYWDIIKRANPRQGTPALRRAPRRRKTVGGMRPDGSGKVRTDGQIQTSETGQPLYVDVPGTTG